MKKLQILNSMFIITVALTFSCNTGGDNSNFQIEEIQPDVVSDADLRALQWRFIGPITGNRGSVVLGHPTRNSEFYFGASNGLWKTEDAGQYWVPMGDNDFKSGNIGAMEISASNPDIMYVGMGEPQMRNNVSWGDGVYKSIDGGKSWTHLGLKETHHISQIRIHPTNPDIVYVGAFGHAFGPNPERGVFRTKDGGTTWEKVLYKSDKAGVIDLVMNPSNPNELFATIWEFERKAWGPKTGGDDSGIWKSIDGGDTWTDITYNKGLPKGGRGRAGLTMSAADSKRVYALVDSETQPALYRSNDLGENWEFVSDYFQIIGRPFYYSHIYANPSNADELWCPNNRLFKSKDAGKTWVLEPGIKDDFHDVWIDNKNPNRMIATNDGGCMVSLTGGLTWSTQYTQKVSQLYRINTDNEFPYNVYATIQDLLSYKVPSASRWGGISGYETTLVGNGETGNAIPNPDDPNIVYTISSGSVMGNGAPFTKNNIKTGQNNVRSIRPEPMFGLNASDLKYRFNWDTPFFISPHDSKTIYAAGNVVFKTTDEGMTWEVISGDLTNDIEERQKITGTPWLPEYFGQEVYSTIHRMAESPLKKGILWVGSDDGLIHMSKDGGKIWENVSIPDAPKYSQIYEIEASPHDAATAYIAICNYNTDDDYSPYLYKTADYGKTWTSLSDNFPKSEVTRTIREDKVRKGLLFVGSETGVYTSMDDGKSWDGISVNMPAVSVVDIKIKDNDLVVGTNGRGIWIMDDITPLREQKPEISKKTDYLYPISDHTRFGYCWWLDYVPGGDPGDKKNYFVQNQRPGLTYYEQGFVPINGERKRKFIDAGDARPLGVIIYFKLSKEPSEISLTILDENGGQIRNYTKEEMTLNFGEGKSLNTGLNKFIWDMRYTQVLSVPKRPKTAIRPIVKPGKYIARLTVDGVVQTQTFNLFISPHENFTKKETDARYDFWMEMYAQVEATTKEVIAALDLKNEVVSKIKAAKDAGTEVEVIAKAETHAEAIYKLIDGYESTFVSTGRTLAEIINLPATILSKMAFLSGILEVSEGPINQSAKDVYKDLVLQSEETKATFDANIKVELDKLEDILQ